MPIPPIDPQNISDDDMKQMLAQSRAYSVVILKNTPKRQEPGVEKIIWEHVRRNFALKTAGVLAIVCAINDGTDVSGVGVFTTNPEDTKTIMDGDPGVQAGVFTYEIHISRSFPGSTLPDPTAL